MQRLRLSIAVAFLLAVWYLGVPSQISRSPVTNRLAADVEKCNCNEGTYYGMKRNGSCDTNWACKIDGIQDALEP